jgi:hypothetical protein
MSGLWTPGGDKNPENNTNTETSQEAMSQAEMSVPDDAFEGMSEEEKTQALEQITKMRAELLETPSRDIIGNHIVGFYELATVHLSDATTLEGKAREDRLAEASLCIDAMSATLNGLGDRLDQHKAPLAAALSQLQMAFTQVRNDDAVVTE